MDEECHIEGKMEFEAAIPECCDARTRFCNRSGFSAHQPVFGSSLRLSDSLLSDGPADRQLLTADPHADFQGPCARQHNERCSNKILHVRCLPAGLARHRSQPREDIHAGDTAMVWRNNKLTGRRGWTGPGVAVAVSPTRTSFWKSTRVC